MRFFEVSDLFDRLLELVVTQAEYPERDPWKKFEFPSVGNRGENSAGAGKRRARSG